MFLGILFGSSDIVEAKIIINEIMYDAEGADVDWIEVYNTGDTQVDIATLKLLVSNSTSNHAIKSYSGSSTLLGGEYGVVVVNSQVTGFTERWSATNIFTASFSLPNVAGEQTATVEINTGDKNAPIDKVTYEEILGAKGDGSSLQLIDRAWKASVPTPGEENIFNPILSDEDEDRDTGSSTDDDTATGKTKTISKPKIKAKIFSSNVVFAGEPANFRAAIMENTTEGTYRGKYYWNFGDGASLTEIDYPKKQSHIYYYPGEYAVVMKYYGGVFTETPDYETRITVKSVPVEVSIKKVGGWKDFGVELLNNSAYEIDVSGWSIIAGRKFFIFPKDSIILAKKSLTISGRLTGFSAGDESEVSLYSSTGEIISRLLTWNR